MISKLRTERRETAAATGLALKEERIARLKEHADKLEAIKWQANRKTGRLHNEKAWRETLDEIAREMGDRKTGIEHSGSISTPIQLMTLVPPAPPEAGDGQ